MKTSTEPKNGACKKIRSRWLFGLPLLLLGLASATCLAQTYTGLHQFSGGDGSWPAGGLALSSNVLYGACRMGGDSGRGTVFRLDTSGSNFAVLKQFTIAEGGLPDAGLAICGGKVYGTTIVSTGETNLGTVFALGMDGSAFTVLKEFNSRDGANPHARLTVSGTTLYGTTRGGGEFNHGTVFRINMDGSGFAVLKSFQNLGDGAEPFAGVVVSGATLYGTTLAGTIFKLGTNGAGFTVLKRLTYQEGAFPEGELALSGSTLYGTTLAGGQAEFGTVFKLNTSGSGFAVLKSFAGSDGRGPRAGLALSGSTLYGTTADEYQGKSSNYGTVFMVHTNGTDFKVLKYFTDGEVSPSCDLVVSGTDLYGTTGYGPGGVFRLSLLDITAPPETMTAEAGYPAEFIVGTASCHPLSYQWFFNGDTVPGGTNSTLGLSNPQPGNIGVYRVMVSSEAGSVTSAPAQLNVIPRVERRPVAHLQLTAQVGSVWHLDYLDTFSPVPNWQWLDTVSIASAPQTYFDLSRPLPTQRFYRAWKATAPPGGGSSLKLPGLIPALTLTGSVGSQVRVDGINQVGPIDAWFTVDTVTLTNTLQLYFDVSVIGQPQRLYRLLPVP